MAQSYWPDWPNELETAVRRFFGWAALAFGPLLMPQVAHADDKQAWAAATVNVDLGNGFRASNEAVFRTSDARGFYEIENNTMIGYKPNKQVTLWLGYTHDPNYSHGDFTVMEHRFRQQVNVDNFAELGNVKFSGRVRLEERWRDGQTGTGWRLRPYLKAVLPIAAKGKVALVASHESFVNLGRTSFQKVNGHERMRNFVGISAPLLKHVTIEGGYLNQHGFVRNGPDTDDHVGSISLTASF